MGVLIFTACFFVVFVGVVGVVCLKIDRQKRKALTPPGPPKPATTAAEPSKSKRRVLLGGRSFSRSKTKDAEVEYTSVEVEEDHEQPAQLPPPKPAAPAPAPVAAVPRRKQAAPSGGFGRTTTPPRDRPTAGGGTASAAAGASAPKESKKQARATNRLYEQAIEKKAREAERKSQYEKDTANAGQPQTTNPPDPEARGSTERTHNALYEDAVRRRQGKDSLVEQQREKEKGETRWRPASHKSWRETPHHRSPARKPPTTPLAVPVVGKPPPPPPQAPASPSGPGSSAGSRPPGQNKPRISPEEYARRKREKAAAVKAKREDLELEIKPEHEKASAEPAPKKNKPRLRPVLIPPPAADADAAPRSGGGGSGRLTPTEYAERKAAAREKAAALRHELRD